ncbi:MAG: hypothetical protein JWM95_3826 [Gemmatimonadetes bacterium]|nr:hypothetical protein [Gemmatimonadota bacterium]
MLRLKDFATPTSRCVLAVGIALLACHAAPDEPESPLVPEAAQVEDPAPFQAADVLEPNALPVITYDGSGEIVHPDALVFPREWRGARFWYAATPYPSGNPAFENPSGYLGDNAEDFRPIPGITNPLAQPEQSAYLSDPDLSYDPVRDEIRLYYRQTTLDRDELFLKTSHKGFDWSVPVLVAQEKKYSLISPAIVREQDGSWRMWTVDASNGGCRIRAANVVLVQRRSRDGIRWGNGEPVRLSIPDRVPWHWDVQYIKSKNEYWALVAAFPDAQDCSRSSVYFARSSDGTTWTVSPAPLLTTGVILPLQDLVYRSTFRYFANEDVVTVWFSGARVENTHFHYALATARYPYNELLRRVNGTSAAKEPARVQGGPLHKARVSFIDAFP